VFDKNAETTLFINCKGNSVFYKSETDVKIVKVANINDKKGTFCILKDIVGVNKEYPISMKAGEYSSLAKILEVNTGTFNNIKKISKKKNRNISIKGMTPGLYLVCIPSSNEYKVSPFLVSLPLLYEEYDNIYWDYSVEVIPKFNDIVDNNKVVEGVGGGESPKGTVKSDTKHSIISTWDVLDYQYILSLISVSLLAVICSIIIFRRSIK